MRNRQHQTVDLIRQCLPTAPLSNSIDVMQRCTQTTNFVCTMTDLMCAEDHLAPGRSALLWRSSSAWLVFVDESAPLTQFWFDQLAIDLESIADDHETACSVGFRRTVGARSPLDVAYRRSSLECAGGFIESAGWDIDLEIQSRLVLLGHSVSSGTRGQLHSSM